MDFPSIDQLRQEDLVRLADEHDDQAFAMALREHPAMVEEDGFYEFISGIKSPYANMLFGINVPDAIARVERVTARLRELEAPAYWWAGPCTLPRDLEEILLRNGWEGPFPVPAMAIDLGKLDYRSVPPGFELREVQSAAELLIWHETLAVGFGLPLEVAQLLAPRLDGSFLPFTAFFEGRPAGTTGMFLYKGVAGIYCVATVPEFRGRGIGSACTALPLIRARAAGYRIGMLQASKMGYPVYQRLGFFDVCSLSLFTFGLGAA